MKRSESSYSSGPNHAVIKVDVFKPDAPGTYPGVMVLHGTFGLMDTYRRDIESFAIAAADAGIVAIIPHYFDRTGTSAGIDVLNVIGTNIGDWSSTVGDGLTFLAGLSDPGRLAVLGFSLGGNLALRCAMQPPSGQHVKAVVDFFGPTRSVPLTGDLRTLPKTFIGHGTDDNLVPIAESDQLVADLVAIGKVEGTDFFYKKYVGQGHGFTEPSLADSRSDAIQFLKSHL